MRTRRAVVLSVLAGVALGAIPVQALHAQSKPPVYVLIDVGEVTDAQAYSAIVKAPAAGLAVTKYSGRYLSRGSQVTALDGTASKYLTVVSFDSADQAQTWYNSPEQKTVNDLRDKSTKSRVLMVQGQ
jgi:uncharacterized protein (DUF1330 family)